MADSTSPAYPAPADHSCVELYLERSIEDLNATIASLRAALKHCRGPLTPSGLLIQQNLGTAVRLSADLENHRTALVNPLSLDV